MSIPVFDYLLIDVSNSFTKLVPSTADALAGEPQHIPTPKLSAAAIRRALGRSAFRRGMVLSSVVPEANAAVEAFAWESWVENHPDKSAAASRRASPLLSAHPPQLLRVNHKLHLGVAIDYPKASSIGADRLANAAGAAAFYGAPAIVVDFGTAVTFDVLSAPKRVPTYVGGVIAPGLEALTDYLYQRTALLPHVDLREPVRAIGRSTVEAMQAGAVHGYRGLVRQILEEIRREMHIGRRLHLIATGGYAQLITARLPEIKLHPNLTLEGLRVIGNLNL